MYILILAKNNSLLPIFAWYARLLTKNNVESSYKKDKEKIIKNCSRLINVLSYWLGSRCKCFGVLWCLWFLASMRATFNRVLLVCFVVDQVSKLFVLGAVWPCVALRISTHPCILVLLGILPSSYTLLFKNLQLRF